MSSTRSKIVAAAGALLMSTALAFAQAQPAAGLAENAWDFTASAGVPGFGPMRPDDDMAALLAHALGQQASPSVIAEAAR
jgi:hypothetical protein